MFKTIFKGEDGVGYTDFRTIWIVHHDVVVFQSVARMRGTSKRGIEWKSKRDSDGDRIHKNNNNHKTILIIRSIPSCLVWSQSMSSKSTTNISEKCPTTASIPNKQETRHWQPWAWYHTGKNKSEMFASVPAESRLGWWRQKHCTDTRSSFFTFSSPSGLDWLSTSAVSSPPAHPCPTHTHTHM